MKLHSDIRYADHHLVDVYEPSSFAKGAILLLHGGWLNGDKSDLSAVGEMLAERGYTAFVPNFRLPPHALFSESRGDVLLALTWMAGSSFEFDRTRIATWGFSAGGTLATEVALSESVPAVSWSGMIDLQTFMRETTLLADKDYDFDLAGQTRDVVEHGGRNDALLRNLVLQLVSNNASWLASSTPLSRVSETSGPMMMINAVSELVWADGAMAMQRALTEAGVASTLTILPGSSHGQANLIAAFDDALHFVEQQFLLRSSGSSKAA